MAKRKKKVEEVYNFDMLTYFKTGAKEQKQDEPWIEGGILYVNEGYGSGQRKLALAIRSGEYTMINGDDVGEGEGERDDLQTSGDHEITTSFACLGHAKLDLAQIKVIDMTQDQSDNVYREKEGAKNAAVKKFRDFEKSIPQGATYSECKDDDGSIREKSYHRAGSMLMKHKSVSYICGQDEDTYFVSKLKTNPRNVTDAFKALKPRRLNEWEKKTGKVAVRQGEWFFIPAEGLTATKMRRHSLPVNQTGGHKHMVEKYEESEGRYYCMGEVEHEDHATLELEKGVLHEAIQNTALDSWSQEGVD